MSKAETLRQSAEARNATRLEALASQVQTVRDAKVQSAEELSAILEPLAQALAALSDETARTLTEIDRKARETSTSFRLQLENATKDLNDATARAQQAAAGLKQAVNRLGWTHYLLAISIGLVSAMLASVFWTLRVPPAIQNHLDAKAVAAELKPAVIEALKPSKGK